MENLLDYLLFALFGHNVTSVHVYDGSDYFVLKGRTWTIYLEGCVSFSLDEADLRVIRELYESRKDYLDEDERKRYKKIFDICV